MKTVEAKTVPTFIRHVKAYKPSQAPGFFDVELRVQWLLAKGNPLSCLDTVIDWESFRPLLETVWDKPAKGPGGPRPNDPLKMFKALPVQRFYNLSDEQPNIRSTTGSVSRTSSAGHSPTKSLMPTRSGTSAKR